MASYGRQEKTVRKKGRRKLVTGTGGTVSVWLGADDLTRLDALAARDGSSRSVVVRRLIREESERG